MKTFLQLFAQRAAFVTALAAMLGVSMITPSLGAG
jgi:hypothetical protein